ASSIPAAIPQSAAPTTEIVTAAISAGLAQPDAAPPHKRPHSHAMMTDATTISAAKNSPPNQIATMASGTKTSAERIRSPRAPFFVSLGPAAANRRSVPPLASAIIGDRLLQLRSAEIRPQRLGEDKLGIGALPQQEIADALLAAGADQQIGIR